MASRWEDPGYLQDEATEALIEKNVPVTGSDRRRFYITIVPGVLALVFLCTTVYLVLRGCPPCQNNYETGFITDFGMEFGSPNPNSLKVFIRAYNGSPVASAPRIPITIVTKRFTNDLMYNASSGQLYNQPLDPNERTYIGGPSPFVNEAWGRLLHAQYIALEPNETPQIPPSHITPISYKGEHDFMELSVFHNLHCLNEIRLALESNRQGHVRGVRAGRDEHSAQQDQIHLDHCVDQMRQALMCHADLTPVPMRVIKTPKATLAIGNGELHTCRDFDAIWNWVELRTRKQSALGD